MYSEKSKMLTQKDYEDKEYQLNKKVSVLGTERLAIKPINNRSKEISRD
jgi:hypothetical protein